MILLLIPAFFILSFILIKSADQMVMAVHRLSKNSGSLAFVISALFLALATSLPELFVGITSGLDGATSLSLGNIIGSNIANLALVGGIATLTVNGVNMRQGFIRKELIISGIAGLLPFFLALIGGGLSRVDGLILIFVYLAYSLSFFKERFLELSESIRSGHFTYRAFSHSTHVDSAKSKEIGRLFIAIAVMLFSASLIVNISQVIAVGLGIPVFVIGLILLSVGTTLPELVFSIRSLKDKEPTMFVGNILGSIIVNSTLIIGVAVFLSPVTTFSPNKYLIATSAFILVFILFWRFIRSKLRLDNWEAWVLIAIYLIFAILEFI